MPTSQDDIAKAMQGLDFNVDIDIDPSDPAQNSLSNQNGLSTQQRWVVQNIFDTQKERRRGYMKQLGYELSKDGEQYRPADSNTNFVPIDPPFFSSEKAIQGSGSGFPSFKELFSAKGATEALQDLGDVSVDIGQGGIVGAAATAAGTVGGAAGSLLGPITGVGAGLASAAVGGAAANAGMEAFKGAVGDLYLDKDIPMDWKDTAAQSLFAGLFSLGGEATGMALQKFRKMGAEGLKTALAQTLSSRGNGKLPPELVVDFMTNPEKYSPKNVKDATEKVVNFADYVFGTSVDHPKLGQSLEGGIHAQVMKDLNTRAESALTNLTANRAANSTIDDVIGVAKEDLQDLHRKTFLNDTEKDALDYINSQLAEVRAKKKLPSAEPSNIIDPSTGKPFETPASADEFHELNFGELRELLGRWQKHVYANQKGDSVENPIVAFVTGKLRRLADEKAKSVGSDFPEINAKRSEIFTARQGLLDVAKGQAFNDAYLGKGNPETKFKIQRALAETDRVLDTNLQGAAQTVQFQKAMNELYKNPSSFGTGSEIGDAARAGLREGTTAQIQSATAGGGAAELLGLPRKVGAKAVSAIVSPLRTRRAAQVGGAFASPDILVNRVSKINSSLQDLNRATSSMGQVRPAINIEQAINPIGRGLEGPAPEPAAAAQAPSTRPSDEDIQKALEGIDFNLGGDQPNLPAQVNGGP